MLASEGPAVFSLLGWEPKGSISGTLRQFLHSNFLDGEGNGTPLQYSCLENPMDEGAWKAAVHGVAEGRT